MVLFIAIIIIVQFYFSLCYKIFMKNPIKIETLYWFDIFPNKNNPLNKEENYERQGKVDFNSLLTSKNPFAFKEN